jgi:diguanylate cyclase (GGDEF)-like protein/PAS domain S-box-containing protein
MMSRAAIICIDDEPLILRSLGEQLKRSFGQQYDLELANSSTEAIALCAELALEKIDIAVIICDQIMPEMTGDQLLIKLHKIYPDTLKILLTGQADVQAVGNLVNASALYRYVTKPWNETDLNLTVKEALKRYQQEKKLAEQNQILIEINQQLKYSVSLLKATLEATADGILLVDNNEKIVSYNQKFIEIWELPSSVDIERDRVLNLVLEKLSESYPTRLRQGATQFVDNNYDCLELKSGKILECYSQPQQIEGKVVGQVWSFRDVSEHKKAQAALEHQALHDSLSNLPNRKFFDRQLARALNQARNNNTMLAVMFLDLDHFKTINDTLGHAVGDLLLKSVVERLKPCIRAEDIIARWGGDEFTLLLPKITCREDAAAIAKRILEVLKLGFRLSITSSIGIAVFPDDGEDAETLLKNTDVALYWVKEKGRNNYQHYSSIINSQVYQ